MKNTKTVAAKTNEQKTYLAEVYIDSGFDVVIAWVFAHDMAEAKQKVRMIEKFSDIININESPIHPLKLSKPPLFLR